MPASKPPPHASPGASAQKAVSMLCHCERGRKTSDQPCPSCGAIGDYVRHGSYTRNYDDGSGEEAVSVDRVRCRCCGTTHALLWEGMIPYVLRSEGAHREAAGARARGASMRSLLTSTGIPRTSLRRMLSRAVGGIAAPAFSQLAALYAAPT